LISVLHQIFNDLKITIYTLALVLSSMFLMGCNKGGGVKPDIQTQKKVIPAKKLIMDGLKRPWSMAFLSEEKALVAEKDGDLLLIDLGSKLKTRITGFPNDLADSLLIDLSKYPKSTYPNDSNGKKLKYNAGIFEVVLHPEFNANSRIYVSYVAEKDQQFTTKVITAILKDNTLQDIETILVVDPYCDGLFHFGGGMVFGNDGKLYITIGERLFGDSLQPELPIAQNHLDGRGKIYRLNPDGSIPSDNPDFGTESVPGMFALGIRAAQGLTVDPRNGDIWFSEHGTRQGDELNILKPGSNYGWPIKSTGGYRGGYVPPQLERDYTDPVWSWYKTIAPTGLIFYTGNDFPTWKNDMILPGLSRGNFWRLHIEDQKVISVEELFINDRHRTRKAVQSPKGELFILTDEDNGKILQIVPSEDN